MRLESPTFVHGANIPTRHTCDGEDISPALTLHEVPEGTVSLALVCDDPDAPAGTWDHWVAFDIPILNEIREGARSLGTPGRNSWGRTDYGGPCPPSGVHRYFFRVYALNTRLGLPAGTDSGRLRRAMEGHVLAEASLMGRYSRR